MGRTRQGADARRARPANLGITADSLLRSIKHVELIASQDELLQVYLFELSSVTVAATQGIARALRNRRGEFLLVLTSDYGRLDFVLLERALPKGEPGKDQDPFRHRQELATTVHKNSLTRSGEKA